MQVMAGYLDKPADVRSAASAAYQKAYDNYLGIDSDTAKSYAEEITKAITDYEAGQQTTYEVSFSQFTGTDYTISAAKDVYKRQRLRPPVNAQQQGPHDGGKAGNRAG